LNGIVDEESKSDIREPLTVGQSSTLMRQGQREHDKTSCPHHRALVEDELLLLVRSNAGQSAGGSVEDQQESKVVRILERPGQNPLADEALDLVLEAEARRALECL